MAAEYRNRASTLLLFSGDETGFRVYNAQMKLSRPASRIATLLFCLFAAAAQAKEAPLVTRLDPPVSILFVGNSFTFYNNAIYTHLRKLLVADDPATRQAIFLKSMTISGAVLADHRGGLDQMLQSRDWDVVVLQGHSRETIDEEMAAEFAAAAGEFSDDIRGHGAEPVLFMTWAYADNPGMITGLSRAFTRIGNELRVMVVPVGLAFRRALDQVPELVLHDPDKVHPSPEGTYLAAAVFYAALFGKSPVELEYNAGLDAALAKGLREAAWNTARGYYHGSSE